MTRSTGLLDTIGEYFGGSGGLSGLFGGLFGGSGDSGTSIFSNLFGGDTAVSADGEAAGDSWGSGFMSGLGGSTGGLTGLAGMDFANLDSISNVDFSNFNLGLENANMEMDELSSPVITPVVDDTEYNAGLDRMEDTWNSHNFDEFAIDAGNSMLLREQASGDATTDGTTSVAFYQYNYSPEERPAIQTYRDTNNLIRGAGNFTTLRRNIGSMMQ